jgi:hypothetical protein
MLDVVLDVTEMKKIDEMGLGKRLEKFHYHLKYQYTL